MVDDDKLFDTFVCEVVVYFFFLLGTQWMDEIKVDIKKAFHMHSSLWYAKYIKK